MAAPRGWNSLASLKPLDKLLWDLSLSVPKAVPSKACRISGFLCSGLHPGIDDLVDAANMVFLNAVPVLGSGRIGNPLSLPALRAFVQAVKGSYTVVEMVFTQPVTPMTQHQAASELSSASHSVHSRRSLRPRR